MMQIQTTAHRFQVESTVQA